MEYESKINSLACAIKNIENLKLNFNDEPDILRSLDSTLVSLHLKLHRLTKEKEESM